MKGVMYMYLRIGDLKLLKIQVRKGDEVVYEGMTEDAPEEIQNTNYESAKFDSEYIILNIQ